MMFLPIVPWDSDVISSKMWSSSVLKTTLKPEKAHFTDEFIIVAKFCDHVLHCLASSLWNVIRQAGRQANKSFSLGDFLKFSIWHLVTI